MNTRTRDETITECADAVASCWQHYCDGPLPDDVIEDVRKSLTGLLPKSFSTDEWWNAYEDQRKQRDAEN